jgi:hypothetical protein
VSLRSRNKRNQNTQRQTRETNKTNACVDTTSGIFPKASGRFLRQNKRRSFIELSWWRFHDSKP